MVQLKRDLGKRRLYLYMGEKRTITCTLCPKKAKQDEKSTIISFITLAAPPLMIHATGYNVFTVGCKIVLNHPLPPSTMLTSNTIHIQGTL